MTTTTTAEQAEQTTDMEPLQPRSPAVGTAVPALARSCSPSAASPWPPVC